MVGDVSYLPLCKLNDFEKGKTLRLTVCATCGAVVADVFQDIHSRWHKIPTPAEWERWARRMARGKGDA